MALNSTAVLPGVLAGIWRLYNAAFAPGQADAIDRPIDRQCRAKAFEVPKASQYGGFEVPTARSETLIGTSNPKTTLEL